MLKVSLCVQDVVVCVQGVVVLCVYGGAVFYVKGLVCKGSFFICIWRRFDTCIRQRYAEMWKASLYP